MHDAVILKPDADNLYIIRNGSQSAFKRII